MASTSKEEISGFYFDEKTKRYYKQSNDTTSQKCISKLMGENAACEKPKKIPLLKLLQRREKGLVDQQFVRNFFKSRIERKDYVRDVRFHNDDLAHLKCGEKSIFCVWNGRDNYVIGTIAQVPYTSIAQNLATSFSKVVDLCEGSFDGVIFIYNSPRTGNGIVQMIDGESEARHQLTIEHTNNAPFFCCSSNTFGNTFFDFVVGTESCFLRYNGFGQSQKFKTKGRVYSVEIDSHKNHIFSGTSHGFLGVYDIRTTKDEINDKISDKCLSNMKLRNSEQILVSTGDSRLLLYDIRKKDVSQEYLGHCSTLRKVEFTFTDELLCTSDGDNTVRVWQASGGFPLKEIKSQYESSIRGCLIRSVPKTMLLVFEKSYKDYYEI